MNNLRFKVTEHAVVRFRERLSNRFKDVDYRNRYSIIPKIKELLSKAEDNKSFLNNTRFMMKLYDKYGYDRVFKYLCYENIAFVAIQNGKEWVVATCYSIDEQGPITKHVKYRRHEIENKAEDIPVDSKDIVREIFSTKQLSTISLKKIV